MFWMFLRPRNTLEARSAEALFAHRTEQTICRERKKKKCDCRALVDLGALAGFEATIQPRASLVCSVDVHWLPSRDPAMILLVASIELCLHCLILLFFALLPILEGSRLFSSSQRRHPRATAGILKCLDLHAFQLPSPLSAELGSQRVQGDPRSKLKRDPAPKRPFFFFSFLAPPKMPQ